MRLAKDLIFFWGLCLFAYGIMGAFTGSFSYNGGRSDTPPEIGDEDIPF